MTVNVKIPDAVLEVLENDKTTLSPLQAGKILGISDNTVRAMADAGQLGFPYLRHKTWLKYQRFLFCGGWGMKSNNKQKEVIA